MNRAAVAHAPGLADLGAQLIQPIDDVLPPRRVGEEPNHGGGHALRRVAVGQELRVHFFLRQQVHQGDERHFHEPPGEPSGRTA